MINLTYDEFTAITCFGAPLCSYQIISVPVGKGTGMNRIEIARLGAICAKFRRSQKITQEQIADDLGCTVKAVSHFEHGRSTNMVFLLWYFAHGMLEWYYRNYLEGDEDAEEVRPVPGEDS